MRLKIKVADRSSIPLSATTCNQSHVILPFVSSTSGSSDSTSYTNNILYRDKGLPSLSDFKHKQCLRRAIKMCFYSVTIQH